MRLERLLLVGVVVLLGSITSAQSKTVIWPSAAIKWTHSPGAAGAKVAVLWGDPAKGAYGALKQVPAGTVLAAHSHSHDSHVVIVKGSMTLDLEGKKTTVGPGSYTMIPGGVPHTSACGAGAACEYFEHMTAAFDSAPAR
jgi:quercetin dioxygenase-like cupin family protein